MLPTPLSLSIRLSLLSTAILMLHLHAGPLCSAAGGLAINELDYFDMAGLNVMVFHDRYPEGHQGGVSIIQHGVRVASNGDLRLEPAPGQWSPIPRVGERHVDRENGTIRVDLSYPDSSRIGRGFNPIRYPDLHLSYCVRVRVEGTAVRVFVDLDRPLPDAWAGRVGFNLELFPGHLFGAGFYMDGKPGFFPRQLNGPIAAGRDGGLSITPLAAGRRLVVAPESERYRMAIESQRGVLELLDGRAIHNNGWYVVRSPVPAGVSVAAVEWLIEPNVIPAWIDDPGIHVSQVGYHPAQPKVAIIELDRRDGERFDAVVKRILPDGGRETVLSAAPESWGRFTRYHYLRLDFSRIRVPGLYVIEYGGSRTQPFRIESGIYDRHVWQPTLETFLPVQMCHMRVNDRYRVWHGLCHMDDALMAPVDTLHFDGYSQGHSTLTSFSSGQPVPGLDAGGWHDAGDYDLRLESQVGTVYTLALAHEAFDVQYDETAIDQHRHRVELHRPDGEPDILQQIEHGVLTILGGYRNLGRLYRGIICPDLRQYVMLGDGANMTDNVVHGAAAARGVTDSDSPPADDRWVFTEENPGRALHAVSGLAAAARVLRGFRDELAAECLETAESLWREHRAAEGASVQKIGALAELILATKDTVYIGELYGFEHEIERTISRSGWTLGRIMPLLERTSFKHSISAALAEWAARDEQMRRENPFGVPYRPRIWGAGWNIQRYGVQHYYLHTGWPGLFSEDPLFNALNFILGCHPGRSTASFVSGVGARSLTTAYGFNRADWSFIPGGVASGTALIRPDFPELKTWPFLWQQTEYVIGGGASHFMFLVLAARHLLEKN